MRQNLIQIEDKKGRLFHIEVLTPGRSERGTAPFVGFRKARFEGYWRVIDLGHIKYTEGTAKRIESDAVFNASSDLLIGLSADGPHNKWDGFDWGLKLFQYDNSFGTKDIGTGELKQPWVLGAEPGMIRWRRPDTAEWFKAVRQRQAANKP